MDTDAIQEHYGVEEVAQPPAVNFRSSKSLSTYIRHCDDCPSRLSYCNIHIVIQNTLEMGKVVERCCSMMQHIVDAGCTTSSTTRRITTGTIAVRAATVSKSKTLNQHHNDDAAADDDEDDDDLFPVVAVHEVYADEISSWFEGPGLKSC